jgi:hypothetical protein
LQHQILPLQAHLEANDTLNFFRFQCFVLEVCRRQAYLEHGKAQKASNAGTKSGSKKKLVPFKIDISQVGVSLQFASIDFMMATLFHKLLSKHKASEFRAVSDAEFHAALLMLSQYLQIINDMAQCTQETVED